jgi:6-phosphogluconolactonase
MSSSNPSFLALSPSEKFVYAVNEDGKGQGTVSAYSFDKVKGKLQLLNKQNSMGDHPCYIATDKTGQWVAAGNYSSGNFSIFKVLPNGSIDTAAYTIQHKGSGPDTTRQKAPHVHATFFTPDNAFLLVPDLGIDKIMVYRFDVKTGKPWVMYQPGISPPGAGPRHIDIHPTESFVYAVEELSGHIHVFKRNQDGGLKSVQRISSLPPAYKGSIGSADVHISSDGRYLYASNRGESNTIAIFRVNEKNGMLTLLSHQDTKGIKPRNFTIDPSGKFLLVANQESDEIVIFKIDRKNGMLSDTDLRIPISSPVCLKWAKLR